MKNYLLILLFLLVSSCCDKDTNVCNDDSINVRFLNETIYDINRIELFNHLITDLSLENNMLSETFMFSEFVDTGRFQLRIKGVNPSNNNEIIANMIFEFTEEEIFCGNEIQLESNLDNDCYILLLNSVDTVNAFCVNNLTAYWVEE